MATTATRKRSTRKSTTTAAKRIVAKSTSKPKAAAKPAAPKREQDSVTVTMARGKRDRKTGEIVPHEPKAEGGVRFEDMNDRGFSPVYLSQSDDKALGSPAKIRVTVKALA